MGVAHRFNAMCIWTHGQGSIEYISESGSVETDSTAAGQRHLIQNPCLGFLRQKTKRGVSEEGDHWDMPLTHAFSAASECIGGLSRSHDC
jgi:hypothetical protein